MICPICGKDYTAHPNWNAMLEAIGPFLPPNAAMQEYHIRVLAWEWWRAGYILRTRAQMEAACGPESK